MPGYVSLPTYRAPTAFDFTGINAGIDEYNKKLERNRLLEQAQQVGAALIPGTTTPAITDPTTQNPLMAPQSVPASPAQASAAAAGRIIGAESGGDPNARNPNSSATGAGQFIDSTWLDTVKRNRPDLASGKSDAEILSLRSNPNLSREMTGAYAAQNSKLLQSAGFASTPGNTYLAHFAGPGGASAVLRADPSTPVTQILSPAAVAANPHIANMTAGDLRSWADRKMGGASAALAPAQAAAATPAPSLSQGIDYLAGARAAAKQGNVTLAVELLGKQQEQAKSLREEQTFQDTHQKAVATRIGNIANAVAQEPDPARQTSMWKSLVAMDPEIAQGLRQHGIDPNDVASGTRFMINQARGITEKLGKDRYVVVGKRLFDTNTQQFVSSPEGAAGGDAEYAKQITYGLDEQGNVVPLQAGDNATLAASRLPPGIKIAGKDPIRLNGGDRWILLDPVTRAKIGEIPINVAAEAAAKEEGKSQVERQNAKPQAQLTAETAISGLDRIKQEITTLKGMPALSSATGNLQSRLPNVWQSTADADSSIRNLKNKLATTALQAMRDASKTGGAVGNVTEKEWPILESMIGNLDPSQGDATFVTRLDEIENYLEGAKARISGAYQQTYGAPPVPQAGNQPAQVQGTAIRVNSPAEVQQLIKDKKLQSGDHFIDEHGVPRTVN